ncbi:Ig-like domain repeat protein [Rhodococcus sp. UNC363MFTsu5.1]|uniref:Ig-like domain repeat protein n=1 Tax=Rhodococcus sp. UNC363MFTsu5.1 TaxID=1449069 RepID=UPI00068C7452|nr:Ig-like domain repeat protein [Rhodococcus sp. UNC363MFTsu5.1]
MRSTRARRAVMIGTAALLLVAPCATLAHAQPTTPALPEDLVAAIQRDLGLNADQYLDRAKTGQELAKFADTLRGKFPTAFSGAWLDAAGTPLVGLADGPDKAAARTAVEAAGYKIKDQPRSEQTLNDLLGQLNTWINQLPAPLSGLVTGAKINTVKNDIALGVHDIAAGQGLQLPDFLKFVRVVQGPAPSSPELPGFGSLGSSDPKPTEPTNPTEPTKSSTTTLNPVTGATVGKLTTLTAKINPAAAGGTVEFEDDKNSYEAQPVGADGTATMEWIPETAGKVTIKATFSGRDGVKGSTTTQDVTVAKADGNPVTTTITLEPIKGATVGKEIMVKAKVNNPAVADGSVNFKDGDIALGPRSVEDDGTATIEWTPTTAGQRTITATFSGFDSVPLATTTQKVTVTGGPKPPAADAIMGGDPYYATDVWGESRNCTLGFNGTDGAGKTVVITAGHCDATPEAAGGKDASIAYMNADNSRIGTFAKAVIGPLDHALIKIDDNVAKRFQNSYVRAGGKAPVAITGVATPMWGIPVCISGRTTGYHCGTVSDSGTAHGPNNRYYGKFTARFCGLGGDSGGALITGTEALGIATQSNMFNQGMCDKLEVEEDINDSDRPSVYSVPVLDVLTDNPGLKIRTN